MKGAIAAFSAAAAAFLGKRGGDFDGSISLLITGDEEGPAINGTAKVLDWMARRGERMDICVVGEPTNEKQLGDMAKIGRRGSMNMVLTAIGQQGHVAYPHLADNPDAQPGAHAGRRSRREPLDAGTEHFQASSLQVTTIDVGNPATNVIPAQRRRRLQHPLQRPAQRRRSLTECGGCGELDAGRRPLHARRQRLRRSRS